MGHLMAPANEYISMNVTEHAWLDRACDEMSVLLLREDFDKEVAIDTLSNLKAAMLLHYAEEEGIMRRIKFNNLSGHKRSHDHCVREVSGYIHEIARGNAALTADNWAEMRRRLDSHVRNHDHSLAEFMAGYHGV